MLQLANSLNYIMATGTSGSNDKTYNSCGIPNGHAYSLIDAFNLTDSSGKVQRMLLLRNPWATVNYTGPWGSSDS
jgi:Calpain family cysteine protease